MLLCITSSITSVFIEIMTITVTVRMTILLLQTIKVKELICMTVDVIACIVSPLVVSKADYLLGEGSRQIYNKNSVH